VDLKLLRHRNFRFGTLALVLSYAAYFSINLLLPQWLQRNMGYTATWAGFAAAPLGVIPLLLTFFVGRYAMRFDLRALASIAFIVMGTTCFLRSNFYLDVDFTHVALLQLLMGLGVGLWFMPLTVILLSDLDPNEIASGSGVATFLRTLAGSFAASLTTFLWDRRAIEHHSQLAEKITLYSPTTEAALTTLAPQGNTQMGAGMLDAMITQQAYQISFDELFYALGWIFFALIIVIWLVKPPFSAKGNNSTGGH